MSCIHYCSFTFSDLLGFRQRKNQSSVPDMAKGHQWYDKHQYFLRSANLQNSSLHLQRNLFESCFTSLATTAWSIVLSEAKSSDRSTRSRIPSRYGQDNAYNIGKGGASERMRPYILQERRTKYCGAVLHQYMSHLEFNGQIHGNPPSGVRNTTIDVCPGDAICCYLYDEDQFLAKFEQLASAHLRTKAPCVSGIAFRCGYTYSVLPRWTVFIRL